ncbi:MAG: ceramidase [Gammaproteobacteria bacterium]|nr:ceramidase [Gammaproteobacteria bacterium]MDH3858004.1 ceramidase [Gammaproteobacteria bacterium]
MVDLYCERVDSGFWAEPVNALTNIGFVFAAWFIWRIVARGQVHSSSIAAIVGVIAAIGIGSFLFHTMATPLTRWLDIIPIFVFQLLYIGFYTRRIINLPMAVIGILLIVFVAASVYGRQFPDVINGSLIYAPALLVIFVLGLYHYQSQKVERTLLLVAASVFLLSIFFRSIDNMICSQFALGTHFLWHILNALVIYLAMRALISNLSSGPRSVSH